jgi:site-specific DNA-cytosine methylase
MYRDQFGDTGEFGLGDVHELDPDSVPEVALATASFPCNDLSLAGARKGLAGAQSSAFWGFIDVLTKMGKKRPSLVLLENVTGFLTSLVRKCADNLRDGLKPLIISFGDGVAGAMFLLKNSEMADRVDVLDAGQFLTANVYERSLFKAAECRITLGKLLARYNEIVATCETDPTLRVRIPENPV